MRIKKIAGTLTALYMLFSSVAIANAQPDWDNYENTQPQTTPIVTTTPPYETQPTDTNATSENTSTTTTTITTTTPIATNGPTLEPTKVALEVGDIEDLRFNVNLNITTQVAITGATIHVEYDEDLLELKNSKMNTDYIGGIPYDNSDEGKYTFTYLNTQGAEYNGTYSTLTFKIKDKEMTSTIIYVSVESMDDANLRSVANVVQNGIVNYQNALPADAEIDESSYIDIKLEKSNELVSLESLGIKDVKEVTVVDNEIALVEDGKLQMLSVGFTNLIVTHNDDTESYYRVIITEPEVSSVAESKAESIIDEKTKSNGNVKIFLIIAAIVIGLAAIVVEYIVIVKPFDKNKKTKDKINLEYNYDQDDDDQDLEDEILDDEDSEDNDSDDDQVNQEDVKNNDESDEGDEDENEN